MVVFLTKINNVCKHNNKKKPDFEFMSGRLIFPSPVPFHLYFLSTSIDKVAKE